MSDIPEIQLPLTVRELSLMVIKKNEQLEIAREALDGIERWCISIEPTYVASTFAKGCLTPDDKTVLAKNLGNLAKAAKAKMEAVR